MTDTIDVFPTVPFPKARAADRPLDPDPNYAALRARDALPKVSCPAGIDAYLVTDYDQIRTALGNPHLGSRGASSMHAQAGYDLAAPITTGNIIQLDGEAHSRIRKLLISEFTVRRMRALRPYLDRIINEHIDAMLAKAPGPVDLVAEFALPIPSLVICEMLGVPYADRDQFQQASMIMTDADVAGPVKQTAFDGLLRYLAELTEPRLQAPTEKDLIGRLILRARETGVDLTRDELVELGLILLVAGHETTANMIGLGTLTLLRNPDQFARLIRDPGLTESAVEELLRYLTVIHFGLLRYATEDVEVGGQTVKAGEWLIGALSVGNRDEHVYPDPDTLDIGREARTHLAFGFGVHQCIGQQLARVELREVLGTLYRRIPTMRLAVPFEELPFKHSSIIYGLRALPITW
ncbi:MAG TPA: cytochrome P450 [Pseudonocardiaceae bacterium]|nr:cytochrome P450 [Pseudonocardiaceae bacterium]